MGVLDKTLCGNVGAESRERLVDRAGADVQDLGCSAKQCFVLVVIRSACWASISGSSREALSEKEK